MLCCGEEERDRFKTFRHKFWSCACPKFYFLVLIIITAMNEQGFMVLEIILVRLGLDLPFHEYPFRFV